MDYPVFQSANLSGTTLTISGYIGIATPDTDFANAQVDIYKSDGAGPGRVYLGTLTADANGNFSGPIDVTGTGLIATDMISGTASDDVTKSTSEFGLDFAVTGGNTPPGIGGAGATLAYTEGDGARVIETTLTVSDADDTNIESATVTLSGGFVASEDVLAFADIGPITFGSFIGNVLTLTGSDTLANYAAALNTVTYTNTNTDDPQYRQPHRHLGGQRRRRQLRGRHQHHHRGPGQRRAGGERRCVDRLYAERTGGGRRRLGAGHRRG